MASSNPSSRKSRGPVEPQDDAFGILLSRHWISVQHLQHIVGGISCAELRFKSQQRCLGPQYGGWPQEICGRFSTYIPQLRYSPTRKKGFNKALLRDGGTKKLENIPLKRDPFKRKRSSSNHHFWEASRLFLRECKKLGCFGFRGVQVVRFDKLMRWHGDMGFLTKKNTSSNNSDVTSWKRWDQWLGLLGYIIPL